VLLPSIASVQGWDKSDTQIAISNKLSTRYQRRCCARPPLAALCSVRGAVAVDELLRQVNSTHSPTGRVSASTPSTRQRSWDATHTY
jgi:hypothetical protein